MIHGKKVPILSKTFASDKSALSETNQSQGSLQSVCCFTSNDNEGVENHRFGSKRCNQWIL